MLLPPRFSASEPEKWIDDDGVAVWLKLTGLVSDGYLELKTEMQRAHGQPYNDGVLAKFVITPAGEAFHGQLRERAASAAAWSGEW